MYYLSGAYQNSGRARKRCIDNLARSNQGDPDNGVAYYHLGNTYAQLGRFAPGRRRLAERCAVRPNLIDAHRSLAAAALRKRDMLGLERSADQLIDLEPDLPEGYALRALSFTNRGQFAQAEKRRRRKPWKWRRVILQDTSRPETCAWRKNDIERPRHRFNRP